MSHESKSVRKVFRCILAVLYLLVIAASVGMIVKPGAAIFFHKQIIPSSSVTHEEGNAYRARVEVDPRIFRTQGILLFEDEHALTPGTGNDVIQTGGGTFTYSKPVQKSVYMYFSTSDNSDPATNGKTYTAYLPIRLLSRSSGINYLLILSIGVVWFLVFALAYPEHRRLVFSSPLGIYRVWERFIETIGQELKLPASPVKQRFRVLLNFWKRLFAITILIAYFYVFMEWIFFVTMPSFMSLLSFPNKVEVLLLSGFTLALVCSGVILLLLLLDAAISLTFRSRIIQYIGVLLPTLILSTLALLLVDNFTYTVFKFGIVTSIGIWQAAYACLFIILVAIIYGQVLKFSGLPQRQFGHRAPAKWLFFITTGILGVSIALALITFDFNKLASSNATAESQKASWHPNVILLGGDGLSAENLSVYGYGQDTTPRLRELARTSLLAENAFTNANSTTGSVTSILTGKLPTQNGVIYAPNILSGENSYQHLPGMLKKEGYLALEYGVKHFVDAYSVNMLFGFDNVNGSTQESQKYYTELQNLGYIDEAYFLSKLAGRITERLQHVFYIREMKNPYQLVTQPVASVSDEEKITQMLEVIEQSDEPVFVHAHLMGTHKDFKIPVSGSSNSGQQDELFRVDLYNEAIRSFDSYVGQVIDRLKVNGEYENTILVIYSDHPVTYMVNQRVPLIIHFPAGQYAGRISQNVQNLDIAPTILDYLGLPVPKWMSGNSLLEPGLDEHRLIFSMAPVKATEEKSGLSLDPLQVKPPFYQFRSVNVLDCQRFYHLDLMKLKWGSGDMEKYVNPCEADDLLSFDEIQRQVKSRLIQDGFDTSSLP